MVYRILLLTLFLTAKAISAHAGTADGSTKLDRALEFLSRTPSGLKELDAARIAGVPIEPGVVSKTEVTAIRTTEGDQESYQFKTRVMIASDKDAVFQALDLAHELVHANHPKENPFDPALTPNQYVQHGIEGTGGEAEAIAEECQVGKEMTEAAAIRKDLKNDALELIKARCEWVWKTAQNDSKWKQSFYFMGQYYKDFVSKMGGLRLEPKEKEVLNDKLEARTPLFSSAVAHKPYPLALLEEYLEITRKICARSGKVPGRALASVSPLKGRCDAIGVSLTSR